MCSSAIQQSRLGQPRHDAPDAWTSLAGLGRAVTSQDLRASCRKQMQSIELVANAGALRQTNMIQRVRLPFRSVMVQHLIWPYPCLYVDALGQSRSFSDTAQSATDHLCRIPLNAGLSHSTIALDYWTHTPFVSFPVLCLRLAESACGCKRAIFFRTSKESKRSLCAGIPCDVHWFLSQR